jgi:hypothetical protein
MYNILLARGGERRGGEGIGEEWRDGREERRRGERIDK